MARVHVFVCLAMLVAAPAPAGAPKLGPTYDADVVDQLVKAAKSSGDARRGAAIFRAPQFACLGCHKVGTVGGIIGPDLSKVGICLTPPLIVEAVLWPKRQVKDEYKAISVTTTAGKILQGYKERETDQELVLRDPATGKSMRLAKQDIEERRDIGTLMPDGLAEAMTAEQRRDLVRFLDGTWAEPRAWPIWPPIMATARRRFRFERSAPRSRRMAALAGTGQPASPLRLLRARGRLFQEAAERAAFAAGVSRTRRPEVWPLGQSGRKDLGR